MDQFFYPDHLSFSTSSGGSMDDGKYTEGNKSTVYDGEADIQDASLQSGLTFKTDNEGLTESEADYRAYLPNDTNMGAFQVDMIGKATFEDGSKETVKILSTRRTDQSLKLKRHG